MRSIRADKTPPRKTKDVQQMVDVRGNPLTTEQGAALVTEKDSYRKSEYGADTAPSVVVNSDSYKFEGVSSANIFSKANPAALPIAEQFAEESAVSRSLLGIDRKTKQQGLFGNVSTYGLDPKDWRVDNDNSYNNSPSIDWWTERPTTTGNYYASKFVEDDSNASLVLLSNPTPFLPPNPPNLQNLLRGVETNKTVWGRYINSLVALYLFKYMVKNFSPEEQTDHKLDYILANYPRTSSGELDELYWDKIWLDISQSRLGPLSNFPIIPRGRAYNFNDVNIDNFRRNSLWGAGSVITSASANLPENLNVSWDNYAFRVSRIFFPNGLPENKGHFKIRTNPQPRIWSEYLGLDWDNLRQDLKDWEFTVHRSLSSVTQLEKDLKLPYFVLDAPLVANPSNTFSSLWPSDNFGELINLPSGVIGNRIGGVQGIQSEISLKSIRSFRYQPGRISGFTYGVKVSEIGAGPGTVIEFGIENETDAYLFRLANGSNFSIVRRSTVPLDATTLITEANYPQTTQEIVRNGVLQYETIIQQNFMNGDGLSGEGETGYILDPDLVTMYKIEFGWYGAIGARFYAYVPVENNESRWVALHTLVIENQLGQPCLADPFFYFKYRLNIEDSSTIRIDQFIAKFGASFYIDGYDEGTLFSYNAQSGVRNLTDPQFSEVKTQLNAIDWVTLLGVKPRSVLTNQNGIDINNRKEIFPKNLYVVSQKDCEIKVVRQKGCPEWAYNHQEGYRWEFLPEDRRIKARFTVNPYQQSSNSALSIDPSNPSTYSAVVTYEGASSGSWRDPRTSSNWSVVVEPSKLIGQDIFSSYVSAKDFNGGSVSLKLFRYDNQLSRVRTSSDQIEEENVYLPFLYTLPGGYDIEFDYYRRDQILLSSVDVLSDEFYIYFVGGELRTPPHSSSIRFGFAWPNTTDVGNPLYATSSDIDWGVEPSNNYDGQEFYEGLPYDFVGEYDTNCIYVESTPKVIEDLFSLEVGEFPDLVFTLLEASELNRLSVPGVEGGGCRGLLCKAGKEERRGVQIISEMNTQTMSLDYFISDPELPWPNVEGEFAVTVNQGGSVVNVPVEDPIVRIVNNEPQYLLPILNISTLVEGTVDVFYNIIYIASMDKKSKVRNILTSKVSPGSVPFTRVFIQARQGAELGGVWIGQKTPNGIRVDPFTPHRSTVSISDNLVDSHGQWSTPSLLDGAVKSISTYTQIDQLGVSTAPTNNALEGSLDTLKSIHTSPKKCGSFLSPGALNSAGIFSSSEYPIRWTTFPEQSLPLSSYYITANTPTKIDLDDVFSVGAESIVNEDDGNLATFFIARSLETHQDSLTDIYMSLNYTEQ